MGLRVEAAVCSSIGRRKNNEDNFYVNGIYMEREQMDNGGQYSALVTDSLQMYAVCDGMGGAEFGEEASLKAVRALHEYQRECPHPDSENNINAMIDRVSRDIDRISLDKGIESGSCGSTISMLILRDDVFRTVNVGDSRVYQLREGKLTRLTKDDSEIQDLLDYGMITPEEAWTHPHKNVITKHLGMPTGDVMLTPTLSQRHRIQNGDRYMICSDGVSDQLRDTRIQEIFGAAQPAKVVAEQMVRMALGEADRNGVSSDNITCVILDVKQAGDPESDNRLIQRLKLTRGVFAVMSLAFFGLAGYGIYRLIELLR